MALVEKTYDIVVIGSGPAGYTAALYASRANLDTLVFQGFESGGQLMLTSDVENYPGYRDGVMGPDMMDDFEVQAARFGAEMRLEARRSPPLPRRSSSPRVRRPGGWGSPARGASWAVG